ncbi:metalloregulator ArsR/SmtB family transcription factor [Pseudonocardia nematodicida]|uniref:Metalloregulator ArsR/SmtB family transcription factor n=1 Tax=Pseudonocardia nematodicida TaxID=1206997 RepID=A0ABV1K979_9PSEU
MTPPVAAGSGERDLAAVARMFADPGRARILAALADGRSLAASVLAAEAGVSPSSASEHLAQLCDAGLLTVERSGRHRYHRLADRQVAVAIEALLAIAPQRPVRSLREHQRAAALRTARTCYDHLAGRLGVAVTAALVERGALEPVDGVPDTRRRPHDPISAPLPTHPYRLGPDAAAVLNGLGVDLAALRDAPSRRPLLRFCLDWSEQRHHLGGRLGAALLSAATERGWVLPTRRRRVVELTAEGSRALGVEI